MPWMPKARYGIMKPYLGRRGRLAHRMMTQTASIQCAFDYADPQDWRRKFLAGALLSPVVTALFANSSRMDGADSGYRSYRQAIWRETDPDRCALPAVVFEPDFGLEAWLDWILDVPTMFRHRARGLVPAGGVPFRKLMQRGGCDAVSPEDWETHISTIFTDVRSYTYIEVRSADLPPDDRIFAVPALWTGILYQDDALAAALELASGLHDFAVWSAAMESAARQGLDGVAAGSPLRDLAAETLSIAVEGLQNGGACAGESGAAARRLQKLADASDVGPRA
jgi:glutamate--cysteine ligase